MDMILTNDKRDFQMLADGYCDASDSYYDFYNAMMEKFSSDPIMQTLLLALVQKAQQYWEATFALTSRGYSVDEALAMRYRR